MHSRRRAYRQKRAELGERALDEEFAEYAESQKGLAADRETIASGPRPPQGDRWTIWDSSTASQRGPKPYPTWLVTELSAVDTELGVLKSGKEADVHLLVRAVPDGGRSSLIAAKRYRSSQHRMFHRDTGYTEGRRDKESRVNRAIAKRSAFGREAMAFQWVSVESEALRQMWAAGVAVPYPIQILGTEVLIGFIGDAEHAAAPRPAQVRPAPAELDDLWEQLVRSLSLMARAGLAHGDLPPYNVLVRDGQLVLIDVPQIVDVISNPRGRFYLQRDMRNIGAWFVARGLAPEWVERLAAGLLAESGLD